MMVLLHAIYQSAQLAKWDDNFEIAHVQFADFRPKSDSNTNPNPDSNLTLSEAHSAFCKLHRLTSCVQQYN